ncbi:MAG: imelysin family protein [Myxococcota bacterium]|nr:imelysin family protein [Myxococcota bacterium]
MRLKILVTSLSMLGFLLGGCGDSADSEISDTESATLPNSSTTPGANPATSPGTGAFTWPANTRDAVLNYVQIVRASYADSVTTAETLQTACNTLVSNPSAETQKAAKEAWLKSRVPYLQTEVFRFYDGPIDDEDGPEGAINAWPLDENYIDYVRMQPNAGIINDPTKNIDDMLRGLNEEGGEANIATGYHAIEFLLWGQDDSDPSDGKPGKRSHMDYVSSATGPGAQAERRGQYLNKVAQMLVDDLKSVQSEWVDGAAYHTSFISDEKAAFQKIITGMIILSGFETGSERIKPALDRGDQEEEHSCFSDNTHVDMIEDVRGIHNVWFGAYRKVDGTMVQGVGVKDVVEQIDGPLAAQLSAEMNDTLAKAELLRQHIPFDQAIQKDNPGYVVVTDLLNALTQQTKTMRQVVAKMGFQVNDPE